MPKARILAIDDQRYFRELLEGLLSEEGYEVQTAGSAEEALHIMESESFDIIVTDLVMPGIDGTQLVGRIKERLPEQEIVMVTGVVDVKTAVEAMKQGATDYILKPFDRKTLADSLNRILQRRRLQREHAQLMAENLEFMGLLSLFERAAGLFSTLALEPLAERLIEGLCLETRAQGGVLWIAEELGSETLRLVGVRGIIRIEEEPEELDPKVLSDRFAERAVPGGSIIEQDADGGCALWVPLLEAGRLLGVARMTDPIGGSEFEDRDRVAAEKFVGFGTSAIINALRFRSLERRSFRDSETSAYTHAYFQDAVRNEIQKATRFGRPFSLIFVDIGPLADIRPQAASSEEFEGWMRDLIGHLGAALRTTDLLASESESRYHVLLPETDAVGAAVLKQRIRSLVEESDVVSRVAPELANHLALSAATYPSDGTQLDSLELTLESRLEETRHSQLDSVGLRGHPFARAVDILLDQGSVESAGLPGRITGFLLSELERRPRDHGLLFLSPDRSMVPIVRERLREFASSASGTEIILVADDRDLVEEAGSVTHVTSRRAGTHRPFALYYGEGPVYAMVAGEDTKGDGLRFFHSDDRSLVEHLAFQLQRDLGLPLGALA